MIGSGFWGSGFWILWGIGFTDNKEVRGYVFRSQSSGIRS
jgi:hypothetical protein